MDIGADDIGISPEAAFPQAIAENDHLAAMRAVLGRGKGTAGHDRRSQHAEIVSADVDALHLLGIGAAGEVEPGAALVVGRDKLKNAGLLFPDVEFGDVGAGERSLRAGVHQLH